MFLNTISLIAFILTAVGGVYCFLYWYRYVNMLEQATNKTIIIVYFPKLISEGKQLFNEYPELKRSYQHFKLGIYVIVFGIILHVIRSIIAGLATG